MLQVCNVNCWSRRILQKSDRSFLAVARGRDLCSLIAEKLLFSQETWCHTLSVQLVVAADYNPPQNGRTKLSSPEVRS